MERWSWNHCLNTTVRRTGFVRKGEGRRRDLVRQEIARRKPEKKVPRARPPDRVDYSTYRLTAGEWLLYGALGVGACGLASYVFYRSVVVFLILMPVGACYPLYRRSNLKKERARRLELQFKEGIQVLSSFLSAGYSLENGLTLSIKELEILFGRREMITEEFRILSDGIRMNRPAEELFMDFGRRSGVEDVDNFAQVLSAAKRSGGELVEIIRQTAGIIRDKVQVKEEIHTMLASRIFEQRIMNLIPFLIVLYIDLTSPGFFSVMYGTWMGRSVMTMCLAAYAGALVLAGKILDSEADDKGEKKTGREASCLDWPEADPLSYGWPFHRNGGSVVAAYRQCAFGRRYPGQGKLWAGGSDIQPDSGGAWGEGGSCGNGPVRKDVYKTGGT